MTRIVFQSNKRKTITKESRKYRKHLIFSSFMYKIPLEHPNTDNNARKVELIDLNLYACCSTYYHSKKRCKNISDMNVILNTIISKMSEYGKYIAVFTL